MGMVDGIYNAPERSLLERAHQDCGAALIYRFAKDFAPSRVGVPHQQNHWLASSSEGHCYIYNNVAVMV
jgi:hypothetical protein